MIFRLGKPLPPRLGEFNHFPLNDLTFSCGSVMLLQDSPKTVEKK